MRPLSDSNLQFKPQNQRTSAEQADLIRQKLGIKDANWNPAAADVAGVSLDALRRGLMLAPDAVPSDINDTLRGLVAIKRGVPVDAVETGGSGLDGSLLREAMNNPDATADDINSFWEQMADLNSGNGNLTTLSAPTPKADLRFKTDSSRTAREDEELIRQRLGVSREAWNQVH